MFIVLSVCMFAYTYTYDIPVALQEQMQHYYGISNVQYALLFSAYAWPNCVIPILVGLLTDKIGVNLIITICFIICVLGNGIFVMGMYYSHYYLMLIGRCIYGVGAESFVMAETPLIYEYFKGKELSFALGANISFSRLGSSVNEVTTYWFYNIDGGGKSGIVLATTMGFILLIFCLIILSGLILHRVLYNTKDLRFDTLSKKKSLMADTLKPSTIKDPMITKTGSNTTNNYNSFASEYSRDKTMTENTMDSFREKQDDTMSIHSDVINKKDDDDYDEGDDKFKLSDIGKFDLRFWLLVINCCLIYGCVEPWMKIGGSFMQSVFGFGHAKANYFLTLPYLTSAILTPFIGYLVDRFGYRCHLLLISAILLTIIHYLFMEGFINEYLNAVSLIIIGIAYSIFCGVIWPSFAIVVNPKTLGTAYGIGVAGYNLFLGTFFIVVGILAGEEQDSDNEDELEDLSDHRYKDVQYFLLSMAILSIFTVCMLWYVDTQKGGQLKIPTIKPKIVHDLSQYIEENDDFDGNDTVSSVGLTKYGK